jgi:pimeloyl-ACP methyl ester carboxylesterase
VEGYLEPFKTERSAAVIFDMAATTKKEKFDFSGLKEIPILLIWGQKDNVLPLEMAQRFKEQYPHSMLKIIKNAGHCPMETHYNEVNLVVEKQLN